MVELKQIFRAPEQFLEQEIEVAGWVRNIRASKNFGFIELNDGSFFRNLQIVFEADLPNFEAISRLGISTALLVKGTLVASPGSGQAFELKASEMVVEGSCPSDYPLQKKRHSFEYLRTIAHLRPRTNTFSAVFRLRSVLAYAIHQYFQERGFIYVQTPIITASDCEGAGEMFQLTTLDLNQLPLDAEGNVDYSQDFFGKAANLTVSGQLNAEAFAMAFGKVYTFGPTFRAENSNTARHAAEFWMLEPEMGFRRSGAEYAAGGGYDEIPDHCGAGTAAGGNGIFQSVCGFRPFGTAAAYCEFGFRPGDLHGGNRDFKAGRCGICLSGGMGH